MVILCWVNVMAASCLLDSLRNNKSNYSSNNDYINNISPLLLELSLSGETLIYSFVNKRLTK